MFVYNCGCSIACCVELVFVVQQDGFGSPVFLTSGSFVVTSVLKFSSDETIL